MWQNANKNAVLEDIKITAFVIHMHIWMFNNDNKNDSNKY